jgi:hypothetical protein
VFACLSCELKRGGMTIAPGSFHASDRDYENRR